MSDARKLVNGYLFGGQHEAIIAHIEALEKQVADRAWVDGTVRVNLRSHTSALRDLATLLEHTGDAQFTIESLRSLADRAEQMHAEQQAGV